MGFSDYWDYAPEARPFGPYLRPGEGVLWNGSPDRGAYSSSYTRAAVLVMSCLPLLLLARLFPHPWGIYPAVAVTAVAAMVAERRSTLAKRARRVTYGVTEQRLLIHIAGRRPQLLAYDLAETPFRYLEEWRDPCYSSGIAVPSEASALGTIAFRGSRRESPWDAVSLPDPIVLARVPAFAVVRDPLHVVRVVEDARALPSLRSAPESAMLFSMPNEDVERI